MSFSICEPAAKVEIATLEENLKLPASFIQFLFGSNGASLFVLDNIDGYRIFGTGDIIDFINKQKNVYQEDWDNSLIPFCEIIGEGDFLAFRFDTSSVTSEYEVVDCFHETNPSEWKVIAPSFADWLTKLIEAEGDKYWL